MNMARSSKQSAVLPEVDSKVEEKPACRRDLLKTAGAAVAGASASGLAMQGINASAANGFPMVLGAQNDESTTTSLVNTSSPGIDVMFRAVGTGQPNSSIGIGAIQALGTTGAEGLDATCNGSAGWALYGVADLGLGASRVASSTGTGVDGQSSAGYG